MSRFFRGAASDSDSSGSESSDEGIPRPSVPQKQAFQKKPVLVLSDSEEETKRIVRRQKDKRFDELKDLIKLLRNSKKIKDMSKILTLFEDLCKAYQKAKPVIDKEADGKAPRFYIRYLSQLEDFVIENWEDKEAKKAMSKVNSKGLTTLRQKLKKYIRENFEEDPTFQDYKMNPDPEGYESVEEEEAVIEVPYDVGDMEPQVKEEEKSDSDSDWASDSEESSSESELEDLASVDKEKLREFFLKPEFRPGYIEKPKEPKPKPKAKPSKPKQKPESLEGRHSDDSGEWKHIPAYGMERQKVLFEKNVEINEENVLKKLNELLSTRGKKGTDPKQMVGLLKQLQDVAEAADLGPAMSIKILLNQISGMFEYQSKMYDCMNYATWQEALAAINRLLTLLKENTQVYCSVDVEEENENLQDETRPIKVHGSLLFTLERLDVEFTKILQEADCHSTDYVEKLKGEKDICALIEEARRHMERQGYNDQDLCRIYCRLIEHFYYKYDSGGETKKQMEDLCQFIYTKDDTKRLRTRAVLCHIYHHALHDRWHPARDLMLMSHLQGSIDHADASDQILHNRAVAQLGLCAFRCGMVKEAHSALSDLQNSGKAKELLAQGLTMRGQDRTPEQEKIERQRQIPYHMHVNLELLECVYLICAMLLEIPQMASRQHEMRRRMLSRSFHYQLKQSERSSLIGPPENTREHVVAASRAMLRGDWRACRDYIVNEKMNIKVWNLFHEREKVRQMVVGRIQEESLRTYLLTYSTVYSTVSIGSLAEMFEMEKKAVHALMSKMIIQEELAATLDEPAECLVMHRVEPSRMQLLSLQLTEKLNVLAENNEHILDPRSSQGLNVRPSSNTWFAQRQQGGRMEYGGGRQQGRKRDYNRGFSDTKKQYGRRN